MARRTTYDIAGKHYPTKMALKQAIQTILHRYRVGEDIRGEDEALLHGVLALHPEGEMKIGPGIRRFFVQINYKYGPKNRGFWLERTDGSTTDWSFVEALNPTDNFKKVKSALRRSIEDQVLEFKKKFFFKQGPHLCPLTGAEMVAKSCHVDHLSPLTFDVLVANFFEVRALDPNLVQVEPTRDGTVEDRLTDSTLDEAWREYHREKAVLRVVSRQGNLSHAKRKS